MDRFNRNLVSIVLMLLLAGCTISPSHPTLRGTVIDAETHKPVEGAVVVVEWTRRKPMAFEMQMDTVGLVEVVTDKDGAFYINGPYLFFSAELWSMSIYKRGYVCWNNRAIFNGSPRTDFVWKDGQNFSLVPWQEGWSHYEHRNFIYSVLDPGGKPLSFKATRPELLEGLEELEKKKELERSKKDK